MQLKQRDSTLSRYSPCRSSVDHEVRAFPGSGGVAMRRELSYEQPRRRFLEPRIAAHRSAVMYARAEQQGHVLGVQLADIW